jgi:hypothetical protein
MKSEGGPLQQWLIAVQYLCGNVVIAVLAVLAQGNPNVYHLVPLLQIVQWVATIGAAMWAVFVAVGSLCLVVLAVCSIALRENSLTRWS